MGQKAGPVTGITGTGLEEGSRAHCKNFRLSVPCMDRTLPTLTTCWMRADTGEGRLSAGTLRRPCSAISR
jgi:hypothetical protein